MSQQKTPAGQSTARCPFAATSSKVDKLIKHLQAFLQRTYRNGSTRRAGHPTTLGMIKGRFIIEDKLPPHLRIGLF
ncbi:hypothetical protein JI739_23070 [Ramlibacter sp. AW1]|uniref:Uncharacterized protein n=1 Tax=Ramlibacter aurantiacus TaxID=2801330 RepID=A0A936ZV98_9BURK|nr:hypothetical protein [Ramlibacter aurantiacus]MBL0423236.1 hypothetical protein [Ramlibacter aurantiacus]